MLGLKLIHVRKRSPSCGKYRTYHRLHDIRNMYICYTYNSRTNKDLIDLMRQYHVTYHQNIMNRIYHHLVIFNLYVLHGENWDEHIFIFVPKDKNDRTGLSNGLVPNRGQGITWMFVDQDLCCHLASKGHKELNNFQLIFNQSLPCWAGNTPT